MKTQIAALTILLVAAAAGHAQESRQAQLHRIYSNPYYARMYGYGYPMRVPQYYNPVVRSRDYYRGPGGETIIGVNNLPSGSYGQYRYMGSYSPTHPYSRTP